MPNNPNQPSLMRYAVQVNPGGSSYHVIDMQTGQPIAQWSSERSAVQHSQFLNMQHIQSVMGNK